MANDISANPWTLDTAGAAVLWPTFCKISHIEMFDYTLDTDTVTITDQNGKVVWEGNGASDLRPVKSGKIGWVNGLKFTQSSNAATRVRVYMDGK